jgi:hypothetical protein
VECARQVHQLSVLLGVGGETNPFDPLVHAPQFFLHFGDLCFDAAQIDINRLRILAGDVGIDPFSKPDSY